MCPQSEFRLLPELFLSNSTYGFVQGLDNITHVVTWRKLEAAQLFVLLVAPLSDLEDCASWRMTPELSSHYIHPLQTDLTLPISGEDRSFGFLQLIREFV
jgi:hypothetical protein